MTIADYDHNRIVSLTAEGDKNTNLQIGVYQGNASLVVFANRTLVAKFSLPRSFLVLLRESVEKMAIGKPGEKIGMPVSRWDNEAKKSVPLGTIYVGRDDKALIYIGIAAIGQAPLKFLIRTPLSFDLSDPMSEVDRSILGAHTLIAQMTVDIPIAIMLTSIKRADLPGRAGGGSSYARGQVAGEDSIF